MLFLCFYLSLISKHEIASLTYVKFNKSNTWRTSVFVKSSKTTSLLKPGKMYALNKPVIIFTIIEWYFIG